MDVHKIKVLVVFTGKGKNDWFKEIELGKMPDTVLHNFVRTTVPELDIYSVDASPFNMRTLFRALRSDAIVSTDTTPLMCGLGLLRALTGGILGPKPFLICVNTSSVIKNERHQSLHLRLLRTCWKRCAGLVCLARFQMYDMVSLGVRADRLTFIPLGIDARFMRENDGNRTGEYILSVGYDSGRDYEYLLRIAPHVPHPIRIVTHEKNIPPAMLLPQNVQVEYNIPITEVRERMMRARLVVVPTKRGVEAGSDCSGQTVVLQSLAAGIPVCASVRPWIKDYLEEGAEFVALPDGDEHAGAAVLNRLWNDEQARISLAGTGKRAVEERFTVDVFSRALAGYLLRRTYGEEYPAYKRRK